MEFHGSPWGYFTRGKKNVTGGWGGGVLCGQRIMTHHLQFFRVLKLEAEVRMKKMHKRSRQKKRLSRLLTQLNSTRLDSTRLNLTQLSSAKLS